MIGSWCSIGALAAIGRTVSVTSLLIPAIWLLIRPVRLMASRCRSIRPALDSAIITAVFRFMSGLLRFCLNDFDFRVDIFSVDNLDSAHIAPTRLL